VISGTRERVRLFAADELPPGSSRVVEAGGIEFGVFNLGDRLVAYRNHCPHMGAPVCLGRVGGTTLPSPPGTYVFGRHGRVLYCPWHGWEFDLETGHVLAHHRGRLARIDVELEDGAVFAYVPRRP
jgi:nitrite reductase (NADH) small subunit